VVEVSYLLQMVKKDFCTASPGSHKKQAAYQTIALLPLGLAPLLDYKYQMNIFSWCGGRLPFSSVLTFRFMDRCEENHGSTIEIG
jgi:hypothetical protein